MAFAREIYIVNVGYDDEDGSKERPVLVLSDDGMKCTVAPITSIPPSSNPQKYHDKAKEEIKKRNHPLTYYGHKYAERMNGLGH